MLPAAQVPLALVQVFQRQAPFAFRKGALGQRQFAEVYQPLRSPQLVVGPIFLPLCDPLRLRLGLRAILCFRLRLAGRPGFGFCLLGVLAGFLSVLPGLLGVVVGLAECLVAFGDALRLGGTSHVRFHPPVLGPDQPPGRSGDADHQRRKHQTGRDHRAAVLPHELPHPVERTRRSRLHRLVRQVPLDVGHQTVRRLVPTRPVLLQRLEHDPVQIPPHQLGQLRRFGAPVGRHARQGVAGRELGAGSRGFDFPNDPQHLQKCRLPKTLPVHRCATRQQFIEQHAQRIHVGAGVDVPVVQVGLFGRHVFRSADHRPKPGE